MASVLMELIILSYFEAQHKKKLTLIFILTITLCSNLFSSLYSDTRASGSSPMIVGLIGAQFAKILIEWELSGSQGYSDEIRRNLISIMALFVGLIIVFGVLTPQLDTPGHLSGFFSGILLGWILFQPAINQYQELDIPRCLIIGKYISMTILIFSVNFAVVVFFTCRKPKIISQEESLYN